MEASIVAFFFFFFLPFFLGLKEEAETLFSSVTLP
jgi:dolichyl-phosphate-mannose--protein O-mannosyl transferase